MNVGATRSMLVVATSAASIGIASLATAHPSARLRYTVDADVIGCPDEAALRLGVARRLGYDPFESGAADVVVAKIAGAGKGLVGTVELRSGGGAVKGTQSLASKTRDCNELAESMTLAMAIAIDPLAAMSPPPPSSSTSATPSSPASSAPTPPIVVEPIASTSSDVPAPPPPAPVDRVEPSARFGVGAIASYGVAPSESLGLLATLGVSFARFAIGLEGRADLPSSHAGANGGEVRANLLAASIVPCFEARFGLFGCALATVGSLRATGEDVDHARTEHALYAAFGARVGFDLALEGPIHARAFVEGAIPVRGASLSINGAEAWSSPFASASLGVAFVYFR